MPGKRPGRRHHYRQVEQETAPRFTPGVDHGAEGIVLLRTRRGMLVWRKGCMVWSGIGYRAYSPACLIAYQSNDVCGTRLFAGGRLTPKRLATHLRTIRDLLGLDDLRLWRFDLTKTLVAR